MSAQIEVVACGQIVFAAGVPSFAGRIVGFSKVVTDNGVGDVSLTLDGGGVDDKQMGVSVLPKGHKTATDAALTFAVESTSDTVKRITCLSGSGAASVLADTDFYITIFKILT